MHNDVDVGVSIFHSQTFQDTMARWCAALWVLWPHCGLRSSLLSSQRCVQKHWQRGELEMHLQLLWPLFMRWPWEWCPVHGVVRRSVHPRPGIRGQSDQVHGQTHHWWQGPSAENSSYSEHSSLMQKFRLINLSSLLLILWPTKTTGSLIPFGK